MSYSDPDKVEIMDLKGKVLKTIAIDNHGERLFTRTWYITVSREKAGEMIFVPALKRNTITKISVSGEVRGTYIHSSWDDIMGLTCWRGTSTGM